MDDTGTWKMNLFFCLHNCEMIPNGIKEETVYYSNIKYLKECQTNGVWLHGLLCVTSFLCLACYIHAQSLTKPFSFFSRVHNIFSEYWSLLSLTEVREACHSIKVNANFIPTDIKVTEGRICFSDRRNYEKSISKYLDLASKELLKLVNTLAMRNTALFKIMKFVPRYRIEFVKIEVGWNLHNADLNLNLFVYAEIFS